jgi:hypothetical protein
MTTGSVPSLFGADPATYEPHMLHAGGRAHDEVNCFVDVVAEVLHARGDEPLAALGSTVRVDFEGDQWSFFKLNQADLERLFGVDLHEMQPYRPLPVQIAEQLELGRTMLVEVDGYYLPDTEATSYRREHVKTSIAPEAIDVERERLRYFHGTGLHELAGEDYREIFRIGRPFSPDVLPPYAEIIRFDAGPRLTGSALRAAALELLREHLARRPATNPFERFGARLALDLPALLEGDQDDYHAYAFATVRMAGSAFEVCAAHVTWLLGDDAAPVTAQLTRIVDGCKVLSFRLARRRPFDPAPVIADLAAAWDEAMRLLDAAVR